MDEYEREILLAKLEIQHQSLRNVGRELHDHIGQLLSVVTLYLSLLEEDLTNTPYQSTIQSSREILDKAIWDIQNLSQSLDSNTFLEFGLRQSLFLELKRIERAKSYTTDFHIIGEPYSLNEHTETILFRMAQEALINATKHAFCEKLTLTIHYRPNHFDLVITDDGKGFSVEEALEQDRDHSRSGLRELQRRATLLNGTCTVISKPLAGTCVEISVPATEARLT